MAKKLLAIALAFLLLFSMTACLEGDETPESTTAATTAATTTGATLSEAEKAELLQKKADEIFEASKLVNLDPKKGMNVKMSLVTKTGESADKFETAEVSIEIQSVGYGSDDCKLFMAMDGKYGDETSYVSYTYIDRIAYICANYGNETQKIKGELDDEALESLLENFSSSVTGIDVPEYGLADALEHKVTLENGNYLLTVKGLNDDAFAEYVLETTREDFPSEEEYKAAVDSVDFDKDSYTLMVEMNAMGKVVSIKETASYKYGEAFVEIEAVIEIDPGTPVIEVPDDANEYTDPQTPPPATTTAQTTASTNDWSKFY
ncbi:MAG: hypothetical protein E7641_02235 [Ruminococcaceae bacterium]|nr:hypothetical protein [Oscillospiraceae bacterium]